MTHRTRSYGGQAVLEGVMMRGETRFSLAVRAPSGETVVESREFISLTRKKPILGVAIVRGAVAFWETLTLGISTLFRSAEIAYPEEVKPESSQETWSLVLAIVLTVGLFIVAPAYLAPRAARLIAVTRKTWVTLVETLIRLLFLLAYLMLISRLQDMQRLLQYHGAEHKVVAAYEADAERIMTIADSSTGPGDSSKYEEIVRILTEGAQDKSKMHPRCGTSFLFIAVICTWIVFLAFTPDSMVEKIVSRLLLMPVIAGVSYEVLKLSARASGAVGKVLRAPGIWLQRFTTREPSPDQIEVAARALAWLLLNERGDYLGRHAV